jgi:hypothetical protein
MIYSSLQAGDQKNISYANDQNVDPFSVGHQEPKTIVG